MKTRDGYDVYVGMVISKNNNDDVIYEITEVKENHVQYRELNWNEVRCNYNKTSNGGLLFAEEIETSYDYL